MEDELLSLNWNNHKTSFFENLKILREKSNYTDATLAVEGKFYPVHKLVMSTCSEYFSHIFKSTPCKSPVIVLKDVRSHEIEALLDYIYLGEANVNQNDLASLLKAAECLRIKGLAVSDEYPTILCKNSSSCHDDTGRDSPPPKKRRSNSDTIPPCAASPLPSPQKSVTDLVNFTQTSSMPPNSTTNTSNTEQDESPFVKVEMIDAEEEEKRFRRENNYEGGASSDRNPGGCYGSDLFKIEHDPENYGNTSSPECSLQQFNHSISNTSNTEQDKPSDVKVEMDDAEEEEVRFRSENNNEGGAKSDNDPDRDYGSDFSKTEYELKYYGNTSFPGSSLQKSVMNNMKELSYNAHEYNQPEAVSMNIDKLDRMYNTGYMSRVAASSSSLTISSSVNNSVHTEDFVDSAECHHVSSKNDGLECTIDISAQDANLNASTNLQWHRHDTAIVMASQAKYSEADVKEAVEKYKSGNYVSIRMLARSYRIPESTLRDKIHGKVSMECGRKNTHSRLLKDSEEQILANYITNASQRAHPATKKNLMDALDSILVKEKEMVLSSRMIMQENSDHQAWYRGFRVRHPNIVLWNLKCLSKARTNLSEGTIRKWFSDVGSFIMDKNLSEVLKNPTRLFNIDETGFCLSPNSGKVLCQYGERLVFEEETKKAKASISVLCTVSASGEVPPPMIVYPNMRISKAMSQLFPDEAFTVGKSLKGYINFECLYEYIVYHFHSWLLEKHIDLPVIVFTDWHETWSNYHLCTKMNELGIIMIGLPSYTTHLMQPLKPVIDNWRQAAQEFIRGHPTQIVDQLNFAAVLMPLYRTSVKADIIRNGFQHCGLYPFDVEAPDYQKL